MGPGGPAGEVRPLCIVNTPGIVTEFEKLQSKR